MALTRDPIDVHVGGRVRLRRIMLGLSQTKLAEALGITFQQVQKYEKGYNRIGSSRLYQIARVLNVSVEYLFEGLSAGGEPAFAVAEDGAAYDADPLTKREAQELVRAYFRIEDPQVRKRLLDLVRSVSRTSDHAQAVL